MIASVAQNIASDAGSLALAWAGVVTVGLLVLAQVLLFLGGLVSILASERYTGGGKVLWVLLVFCLPLLGPIIWFAGGRRAAFRTTLP